MKKIVLLAAMLAGGTCGLLGSFLVLRRESLVGDALSHAVLPGIVLGFAVTGARVSPPLFESMELLGRECSLRRLRAALG